MLRPSETVTTLTPLALSKVIRGVAESRCLLKRLALLTAKAYTVPSTAISAHNAVRFGEVIANAVGGEG